MFNKPARLLPFFLISVACAPVHAQDDYARHQIFAGYGFGYTNRVFSELGSAFGIDFIQTIFSDSADEGTVMPLYAGYRYFFKKHFSAGVNLSFPTINNSNQSTVQSKTADKQQFHAIIFMPRMDVHYVNKRIFNLYSGVSIGVMLQNKDEVDEQQSNIAPAYQITALGFSIGKIFGVFTEIGYGVNGVLSIGIATKFGEEDFEKKKAEETKFAKRKAHSTLCIRL